jgi:excisionase family DNA binding protein
VSVAGDGVLDQRVGEEVEELSTGAEAAGPPEGIGTGNHMRYRFRIIRTQTAERSIRATDEDAAMQKLREELDQPYGFFGRWEQMALDVELVGVDSGIAAPAQSVDGGPLLLSVKDAAEHLGISRGMMYELINAEEIQSIRIGRRRLISREALNRFVEVEDAERR